MTKSEAIHRAALRKHRHKGNYIATHEALVNEIRKRRDDYDRIWELCAVKAPRRSLWQIIKGWFA